MKLNRSIGLTMVFAILLSACSMPDAANNPSASHDPTFADSTPVSLSDPAQELIALRGEEITGLDVVDTNGIYPNYFTTAERFYDFGNAVKRIVCLSTRLLFGHWKMVNFSSSEIR